MAAKPGATADHRTRRPLRPGWRLRRRLYVTFGVLAVFVVAGTVLGIVSLSRLSSAQHRQVDRLDPAIQTNTDLFIALLNQETGVRGFALTRDASFLLPYEQGREQTNQKLRILRQEIGDDPRLMRGLSALEAAARRWQANYAEPSIATIRATPRSEVPSLPFARGKQYFDTVRADYERLGADFTAARASARDQLSTSTTWLVVLVVAALVVATVAGTALWIALRRWIIGPLGDLRREVRVVTEGDLQHRVAVSGPPDIVEVGDDAEFMRQRIVAEYFEAVQARSLAQEAAERMEAQAEELRRSNGELEQFAYIASHDLQEPLRKVASFCQMLERRYAGQLDERGEQYIRFAVDGAKRMQNLINDLLAFSRVGRTTSGFRPVDLNDCVHGAISDLDALITETGGTVNATELPVVSGDPSLLRQLFLNLIGNALKFRADEPPMVRITAARTDELWTLTVADNGIGIDPRYAEKVFAIFARLHPREQYEGTGIGLALCRKIVEFHGGTIEVVTDPPVARRGTTIRLTLPVVPETERLDGTGHSDGAVATSPALAAALPDPDDAAAPVPETLSSPTTARRTGDA